MEAPRWPPLPGVLRRELDGRSVYTRPGTARYPTTAQLPAEEQLVAGAQAQHAPRLPRELAARRLGADAGKLEAQLHAFAALTASPGARVFYDTQRAKGLEHNDALRRLANRFAGILHGCLITGTLYDEQAAWGQEAKL